MKHQQHVENLLIRYRGEAVHIKAISGEVYEGVISDVTNDYVALKSKSDEAENDVIIVLLQAIESIRPQRN
jgi:ferredoxin-fold anticodon binding domain-containing protein